ncbi:hypothetical protein BH10CYA1_BH10CYA1_64980 [soil metagenome]
MSKKGNHATFLALTTSCLLLAATMSLIAPQHPAWAAETWMPKFDINQSVYVDPSLSVDAIAPVDLRALPPKLASEAARNHLKVFVVMAKKGDETVNCSQKFAVCKLEQLMGRWNAQLPQDDYVLLLIVRSDTDWRKVSYAANLGNRPRGFGVGPKSLNLEKWAKGTNGGVAFLPRDTEGYVLHVVADINDLMDKAKSDQEAQKVHEQFMSDLPGYLMLGTGLLSAIALGVFLAIRYGKEREEALKAILKLRDSLFKANGNYMEIQDNYLDFLSEQGDDWKTRFQGQTLTAYTQAVTDYAALSARISCANDLMSKAEKEFAQGNYFSVQGFREAIRLLTTAAVTVSGDSLPLNERSLFSSEVQEDTYNPSALLENMDQLFQRTNQALSSILESFSIAKANSTEVTKLSEEISKLSERLTTAGVSTTPYSQRLSVVLDQLSGLNAALQIDPLSASTDSGTLRDAAKSITTDMNTALSLAHDLAAADASLVDALSPVKNQRAQQVQYSYPGSDTTSGAAQSFRLDEDGYNPDAVVDSVQRLLEASRKSMQAAKLPASVEQKNEALKLIAQIPLLVSRTLEAKDYVSSTVTAIASTLSQLNQEIPTAQQALATLTEGFLPVNYASVERNATQALATASQTVQRLVEIKHAYFEQRFIGAAAKLTAVRGDIQSSRDGLLAIHSQLETLVQLRDRARQTSAQIQDSLPQIKERLEQTKFTTAAQTDEDFRDNGVKATSLAEKVAADKADWIKCDQEATSVQLALTTVCQNIEANLSAYGALRSKVEECQRLFDVVVNLVNNSLVRTATRQDLQVASQTKVGIEESMQVAKSDWQSLTESLHQVVGSLNSTQQAARQDIAMAERAENAINVAARTIDGVPGSFSVSRSIGGSYSSFGYGVSADVGTAQSRLRNARSAYERQEYEEAINLANSASSSAEDAQAEAERQVQVEINAAISAWEYQERLRREAQEEADRLARQAADDLRRATESNDDSSNLGTISGPDTTTTDSFGGGDF